jgi:hypothetical protein
VVAHDARSTEHLDRVGCDGHRGVGGEGLRVGAEQAGILSRVESGAGAPDEEPGCLDLHRHVGELEADSLPAEDRAPEGLALASVRGRVLEGRPGDTDGARCHLRAGGLEEVERDLEALALLAEEPIPWNAGIAQEDGARVGGAQPDLAFGASGGDPCVVPLDDESRDLSVELGEDDRDVRIAAVRDVDLLPVQDVRVPVVASLGADRSEIGAGVRLGEGDRGECSLFTRE